MGPPISSGAVFGLTKQILFAQSRLILMMHFEVKKRLHHKHEEVLSVRVRVHARDREREIERSVCYIYVCEADVDWLQTTECGLIAVYLT